MKLWETSSTNRWWRPRPGVVRYPDTAQFEPGDLLLFSPSRPNDVEKRIVEGQKSFGFNAQHAAYTHAAVYLDCDCLICEAIVGRGVQIAIRSC